MKFQALAFVPILLCSFFIESAQAAFCALRDPVETIEKLFPDSTSHKSVIKVVGEEQRKNVSRLLPPNTLHFSELGQHTLYVVFNKRKPLGYLHVRSEASEWGLVEIAWALSTDLRVVDFHLQRCRSRAKSHIEAPAFKNQLAGLSFAEMKSLLSADGKTLQKDRLRVAEAGVPLAEVVIRCALKTMLVTEQVWSEEVKTYGTLARTLEAFGQASTLSAISASTTKSFYSEVARSFPGEVTAMELSGIKLYAIRDLAGTTIGALFEHHVHNQSALPVEWYIAPDGRVLKIHSAAGWPDAQTANAFASHIDQTFDAQSYCSDRPQLLTKQAALMGKLVASR